MKFIFFYSTVQYTTKPALEEFVQNLLELPSGTHGCIVEEVCIVNAKHAG